MHSQYTARVASSDADLRRILELQRVNLTSSISPGERASEGFVTLRHNHALLREICRPHRHIVATSAGGDEIVAYALTMMEQARGLIPELGHMFDRLDAIERRGGPPAGVRWYVMGQICVDKPHRSRGVVDLLYRAHREHMSKHFDMVVTVIDAENPRSMRAHEKAGFVTLDEYHTGRDWRLVGLDLRG